MLDSRALYESLLELQDPPDRGAEESSGGKPVARRGRRTRCLGALSRWLNCQPRLPLGRLWPATVEGRRSERRSNLIAVLLRLQGDGHRRGRAAGVLPLARRGRHTAPDRRPRRGDRHRRRFDGGFEVGASRWSLSRAPASRGNESDHLNDAGDFAARCCRGQLGGSAHRSRMLLDTPIFRMLALQRLAIPFASRVEVSCRPGPHQTVSAVAAGSEWALDQGECRLVLSFNDRRAC